MANEIQWRGTETGVTLYATIRSKTGTQWNTAGTPNFEAVTAANWADYDIALAESSGNYFYVGTFPAIAGNMVAGWYWVDVYKRAGAGPAITDVLQGTIVGYWDGTSLLPWAGDTRQLAGTAQTARDIGASVVAATVSDKTGYSLATAPPTAAEIKTAMEAVGSHLALILGDTNELQTDWANGGRLDLILDAAAGASGGTGARTVVITVNDGTTPLESASVRLTKGAETYILPTNTSGVATFNVDDGTWTVAITLANYAYSGTTLVVDGDEAPPAYSMTAINITAPAGTGLTTGYVLCLGTDGLAEASVNIYAKMVEGSGTAGHALDTATITMISGVDGVAQHTGFERGAWYTFRRGTGAWHAAVQAPEAATWAVDEILGSP